MENGPKSIVKPKIDVLSVFKTPFKTHSTDKLQWSLHFLLRFRNTFYRNQSIRLVTYHLI